MMEVGRILDAIGIGDDIERIGVSSLDIDNIIVDTTSMTGETIIEEGFTGLTASDGLVNTILHIGLMSALHTVHPEGNRNDDKENERAETSKDSDEPLGDGNLGR